MTAGELALEPNVTVHSLGKERGFSEPRRLVEFYRLVSRVMREHRIDACFAHMAPLFAALFAPVAKARRIPILLWYAHGSRSRTLRVAHYFSDRAVTSTPASFNIPSDKLFVIGQGIDVDIFRPPAETPLDYEQTALTIGRLSRSKGLDEMLAALAQVREEHGLDVRLQVTGEPLTQADQGYADGLRHTAESLGISEVVTFAGRVPFREVPSCYQRGALFLNLSETGSLDKAILESMASGCVPISRNASFRELAHEHGLGSLVPRAGPDGLAESIVRALELSPAERADLVRRLRRIVEQEHSLSLLTDRLIGHLAELSRAPRGP
jgi:glycosyltransferase involved in cell wall biosynthesis